MQILQHRSSSLDTWSNEQLMYMKLGGNARAKTHFKKHGIADAKAAAKFNSAHAKQYKAQLKAEVDKAYVCW